MKLLRRLVMFSAILLATLLPFSISLAQAQSSDQPSQQPVRVYNPLGDTNAAKSDADAIAAVQLRLANLLATMFKGLAALSLIPIVVGGMQMIISQGNDEKVSRGKNTVYFGVIGLFLALAAIAIFTTVVNFLLGNK